MSFNNLEKNDTLNNKNRQEKKIINKKFLDNPNIIFNKNLYIQKDLFSEILSIEKFDFFILNNISYIVIPDYFCLMSNSLFIFKINKYLNLEKQLSLEGHRAPVLLVKNFYDENTNQNYLISSDKDFLVIIWKIINEKSIIIKRAILTKYDDDIYSGLILFQSYNILILTSIDINMPSTEYDFNTGDFKRNIPGTKNNKTFYILNYNDLIIELCMDTINIYNLLDDNDTHLINNDELKGQNNQGCIINDILIVNNNSNGKIILIDLNSKNILNMIKFKNDCNLWSLTKWNLNYIIVSDIKNRNIYIIDLSQKKIINSIKVMINPICIKKIELNKTIYKKENNNFLFILGDKMYFELWSKNNI